MASQERAKQRAGGRAKGRAWTRGLAAALTVFAVLAVIALLVWRNDILQSLLNPELPYAVYKPPPPPDYETPLAWSLLPGPVKPGDPPVDVFFVHPTTFDGGRDWNGPIDARPAARLLDRVMLPNYAGPFAAGGRVFAPRYRQASLYSALTLFDDAIEAREFPYGDVRAAFQAFERRIGPDRPFIVVGAEQGGTLAARLLRDEIGPDSDLRRRLVAAYLIEAVTPADEYEPGSATPACEGRSQTGCVLAWISAPWLDFGRSQRIMNRSLIWNDKGRLAGLNGRLPLCVNPLLGEATDAAAPPRLNRGAANATGLEWGARPGFMARQVGAQCLDGILRVTRPRSALLRPYGGWADRLRVAPYNLFWADLEADAQSRAAAWLAANPERRRPAGTY
ncbi:MAG TPA: DUF3089 domain-containing protein [Caulobacteraceae bacterium]|nr:DUF3089 domain-containing protein [Caulobacteraceae bacterium]